MLWFVKTLVEQQLEERAQQPQVWGRCAECSRRLENKGFVRHRMLTLVGWVEWKRLGCLLVVFLPFELAVHLLGQLCGVCIRDDTLWHWVQQFGDQAMHQLHSELEQLAKGIEPSCEPLDPMLGYRLSAQQTPAHLARPQTGAKLYRWLANYEMNP